MSHAARCVMSVLSQCMWFHFVCGPEVNFNTTSNRHYSYKFSHTKWNHIHCDSTWHMHNMTLDNMTPTTLIRRTRMPHHALCWETSSDCIMFRGKGCSSCIAVWYISSGLVAGWILFQKKLKDVWTYFFRVQVSAAAGLCFVTGTCLDLGTFDLIRATWTIFRDDTDN